MKRALVVARHDWQIARSDPIFIVIMTLMPLLVMAFLVSTFRVTLLASGYPHANGADQAVPGITVLFSFFLVNSIGLSVFREYGWGTWSRLRSTPIRRWELMTGKALTPLVIHIFQLSVLFIGGALLFHFRVAGSLWLLVSVAASFA